MLRTFVRWTAPMLLASVAWGADTMSLATPRNSAVALEGRWMIRNQSSRSSSNMRYMWMSDRKGDAATFTFEGTRVDLSCRLGARNVGGLPGTHTNSYVRQGLADLYVDGVKVKTIDFSGGRARTDNGAWRASVPGVEKLATGRHVVRLVNAGMPEGGDGRISFFGFETPNPVGREPNFSQESPALQAEVRKLPPLVFFTGDTIRTDVGPLASGSFSHPESRWGTAIKIYDPAHPEKGAHTIFQEGDSAILDLRLTPDARRLYFSMRRHQSPFWQVFTMSVDGGDLRQLTEGNHHNTFPAPLPDGRIAFISTRDTRSFMVCSSGPTSRVHVMDGDGGNVQMLSSNTLSDYALGVKSDGRLLYTRWEYVDWNLMSRQSLWTQYPDGRHLELWFGNLIDDPPNLMQAEELPWRPHAAVCTFAPHHGFPSGAIGIVDTANGPEDDAPGSVKWLTPEFPSIMDVNHPWAYCWPYPVKEGLYLCSYGGGGLKRYRLSLIDEKGGRATIYDDGRDGAFRALPLVAKTPPKIIAPFRPENVKEIVVPETSPTRPWPERVKVGTLYVTDVANAVGGRLESGRVKAVRILQQVEKEVEAGWTRVFDQQPLMSAGTYYAKRVWGYAPVESDGSAYFEVPALKEVYLQLVDAEGRAILSMTSALNVMPGERRSCAGCHEGRVTASGSVSGMAARRQPTPLALPNDGRAGVIDYCRDIQPIWDRRCVSCHGGTNPAKGLSLEGGYTRYFNLSYDNLIVRSQSLRRSFAYYGGAAVEKPLVHAMLLNQGYADVLRVGDTGTLACTLPDHLAKSHCKVELPDGERRRIYEWLDALVPYYATAHNAHPKGIASRDKWHDPATGKFAGWTRDFLTCYQARCAACHGEFDLNSRALVGDPRWSWINLSVPEWSAALWAHVPKDQGGRGCPAKGKPPFAGVADPTWKELEAICRRASETALVHPEADMPGFLIKK